MEPSDERFVYASWFESFLKANRLHDIPFEVYKVGMQARIERLIKRSEVRVACATAVPDEILGYAVVENGALHWLYVKSVYRRQGIARTLAWGTLCYTHKPSSDGQKFARALNLQYQPQYGDTP